MSSLLWLRRLFAILLVVAISAGAWWAIKASKSDAATPLLVEEEDLNFGEVWEDTGFIWTLKVRNRSGAEVHVDEFAASCSCVSISPRSVTIPADQSCDVALTLNLSASNANPKSEDVLSGASGVRDFSIRVGAKTQGPNGGTLPNSIWTVHGRVKPALQVEPRGIGFGDSVVRGKTGAGKEILVRELVPLSRLQSRCDPDIAIAKVKPGSEAGTYRVHVTPRGDVPSGPLEFTVLLEPHTESGPLPVVRIPAQGRVVENVRPSLEVIQFGARPVGTTVQESLVLSAVDGSSFTVEKVEPSESGISVKPQTDRPGSTEYHVSVPVTTKGDWQGSIRFLVRNGGDPAYLVTVKVGYLGT